MNIPTNPNVLAALVAKTVMEAKNRVRKQLKMAKPEAKQQRLAEQQAEREVFIVVVYVIYWFWPCLVIFYYYYYYYYYVYLPTSLSADVQILIQCNKNNKLQQNFNTNKQKAKITAALQLRVAVREDYSEHVDYLLNRKERRVRFFVCGRIIRMSTTINGTTIIRTTTRYSTYYQP
jgi:hypothetical protein